jgi:hypothetical protein
VEAVKEMQGVYALHVGEVEDFVEAVVLDHLKAGVIWCDR